MGAVGLASKSIRAVGNICINRRISQAFLLVSRNQHFPTQSSSLHTTHKDDCLSSLEIINNVLLSHSVDVPRQRCFRSAMDTTRGDHCFSSIIYFELFDIFYSIPNGYSHSRAKQRARRCMSYLSCFLASSLGYNCSWKQ
jgi:hypothetical protein